MEVILAIVCILIVLIIGIYGIKEGISEQENFIIVLGVICILIVVLPCGYFGYDTYEKSNCVVKSDMVNSYVINKEYVAPYTTMIMSGKVLVPINHDEEYNLTFKYKNVETTIDNEQLYSQVNKGEEIQMDLKTYTQHNGKIYNEELELLK